MLVNINRKLPPLYYLRNIRQSQTKLSPSGFGSAQLSLLTILFYIFYNQNLGLTVIKLQLQICGSGEMTCQVTVDLRQADMRMIYCQVN